MESYVEINNPAGVKLGGAIAGAAGDIALRDVIPGDMSELYPAVDATNGPMTADSGLVYGGATMPVPAGKTLYRWDSGVYRTQGMVWEAANTAANTTGQVLAINNSTPRKWTYGTSSGKPYESNHDFATVTDSLTVTIVYWHWNGYTSSNYHDMRVFVEHHGRMKHLRDANGVAMPKQSTAGGQWFSLTLTFKEARERQLRFMLPANCYVLGLYIDATATIRKAPNVLWFAWNGDSWGEPNGNAGPVVGGTYPTATMRTMGVVQELAVATGAVVTTFAEGGTGEYICNADGNRLPNYTNSVGESVFHGEARLLDFYNKFGGLPIVLTVGGWNDGTVPGSAATARANYQARVQQGINLHKTRGAALTPARTPKLIYASIQPVDQGSSGGNGQLIPERAASLLGQQDAVLDVQNAANVIGWINLLPMWLNQSMAGQRGPNVNTTDYIHLNVKGAELVARWLLAAIRMMTISASNYNDMIKAA